MYITLDDLDEYRRKNYPLDDEANLKPELFHVTYNTKSFKEITHQNHFDISNLIVDAENLEDQIEKQDATQEHNSEYARSQREHMIRFRKEIQEKGLQVKNGVVRPTLNY